MRDGESRAGRAGWDTTRPAGRGGPGGGAGEAPFPPGDAEPTGTEGGVNQRQANSGQANRDQADGGETGAEVAVTPADLAQVTAERDEYLDALRRLQAEFDNYRKRTMRQQTELLDRAAESLLARLLPVLDAMDLAAAHVADAGAQHEAAEAVGAFVQIGALLRDSLAKEGLERIDAAGVSFDPTVHDAVGHLPADTPADPVTAPVDGAPDEAQAPGGTVVAQVLRPGYRLKDRVLRPAMVNVRG